MKAGVNTVEQVIQKPSFIQVKLLGSILAVTPLNLKPLQVMTFHAV